MCPVFGEVSGVIAWLIMSIKVSIIKLKNEMLDFLALEMFLTVHPVLQTMCRFFSGVITPWGSLCM